MQMPHRIRVYYHHHCLFHQLLYGHVRDGACSYWYFTHGIKIVDGVTDLLAGYVVDNTKTKLGKGRPYEFCVVLAWACTVLLFSASPAWSLAVKCVWIFVMYTLVFSIFSTFLNAGESPYIIRAFGSRVAVTQISALGGIVIIVFSLNLLFFLLKRDKRLNCQ